MTYQSKVRYAAKKIGAEIVCNSTTEQYDYEVLAPNGMIFSCDSIHLLVGNCFKGDPAWYEEVWKDLYDRISFGVEKCETPDCEWCSHD